ncbi:MAG: glutamate--tRNA ligase family protein [Vicinamibacterales bacterium]
MVGILTSCDPDAAPPLRPLAHRLPARRRRPPALFNWLYARRHGGAFILRIEDTDTERSSEEMVAGILDGLKWLGIDWDEGPEVGGPHAPYFQSERLDRHRAAARTLLEQGRAFEDDGAIRFRVPPGRTTFVDSVHGPIDFDNEHIEASSSCAPTETPPTTFPLSLTMLTCR